MPAAYADKTDATLVAAKAISAHDAQSSYNLFLGPTLDRHLPGLLCNINATASVRFVDASYPNTVPVHWQPNLISWCTEMPSPWNGWECYYAFRD